MSAEGQPAESLVGTVLDGSYRIDGLLGEGGMGAVYQATHLRLDQRVAVKVMARELAANPEALERFRREARVTSGLGHPHIVHVSDFSVTPSGEPFLVMEYLDGEDLDRRLRRVGRLPAANVVHIVKQVASALAVTHAKSIVHRDLKPGNIYLLQVASELDFVKVLDFGISKVRSATTKLTRTTSVIGTPNYMSPEQAKGKTADIDERTDQWALACIAWECLSGEGPFVGENVPSILFQIVHEPPPSLLTKVEGLHPRVEDVLVRALSKDKGNRFATVMDFAVALEAAVADGAQTHGAGPSVPTRTMRFDGSNEAEAAPEAAGPKPTTFTQTAGEVSVDDGLDELPTRPKWVWGAIAAGALVMVTGSFLLLRPNASPKSTIATPALAPPTAAPPRPVEPVLKEAIPVPPATPPPSVPSQPMTAQVPGTAPTEPTSDAPKDLPRKHDVKRKGPLEVTSPSLSLPKPENQPMERPAGDPFETKAKDQLEDPFEARARTREMPSSPKKTESHDKDAVPPYPTKSTKPRNKEDKWRVD